MVPCSQGHGVLVPTHVRVVKKSWSAKGKQPQNISGLSSERQGQNLVLPALFLLVHTGLFAGPGCLIKS